METSTFKTRQERRARRQRRFVTAREARLAARLARLDYKTSGETGALTPPTKERVWYPGNRKNAHQGPPGRRWDRSGRALVVAGEDRKLPEPVARERWWRLQAEK